MIHILESALTACKPYVCFEPCKDLIICVRGQPMRVIEKVKCEVDFYHMRKTQRFTNSLGIFDNTGTIKFFSKCDLCKDFKITLSLRLQEHS